MPRSRHTGFARLAAFGLSFIVFLATLAMSVAASIAALTQYQGDELWSGRDWTGAELLAFFAVVVGLGLFGGIFLSLFVANTAYDRLVFAFFRPGAGPFAVAFSTIGMAAGGLVITSFIAAVVVGAIAFLLFGGVIYMAAIAGGFLAVRTVVGE